MKDPEPNYREVPEDPSQESQSSSTSQRKIEKGDINVDNLKNILKRQIIDYQKKKRGNQSKGIILGIGGIILSLGATVSGILGRPEIAAISAAIAASTQATLYSFPVDKRSSRYRLLRIKVSNLIDELEVTDNPTQEQLHNILDELKIIKLEASDEDSDLHLLQGINHMLTNESQLALPSKDFND